MNKSKSEKQVLSDLRYLFGKKTVWLTQKNACGDRGKYEYEFSTTEIAKRYNATAISLSYQYDKNISSLLEDELSKNGFKVFDMCVGSWVHGYIHRKVTG